MNGVTNSSVWNSLEVVRIGIDVLVPLVLLMIGLWAKKIGERIEQRASFSQMEVEWRIRVFEEINPLLNAMYCFFNYVGEWKTMSPGQIIQIKRRCDRIIYSHRFFWSAELMRSYAEFVGMCFEEYTGIGQDLRLRANVEMYRKGAEKWEESWEDMFVPPDERIRRAEFGRRYEHLLAVAVRDLKIFGSR